MKITERFEKGKTLHNPTGQVQTHLQTLHEGDSGPGTAPTVNSVEKREKIGLLLVELARWETPRTRKDVSRMKAILGMYKPDSGWEDKYRNEMMLLVNSVTNKEVTGAELYEMVKEI